MLKKGDKCHVRLKSGEIVEAVYNNRVGRSYKLHEVSVCNKMMVAVWWRLDTLYEWECRFVCMTGIKGKDKCSLYAQHVSTK